MVPGPFLRSTDAAGRYISHMPITPQSLGDMSTMLHKAHELTAGDDPDFDLEGRDEPSFGHHPNRRYSNTVARRDMLKTGATEQEIDLNYGWNEHMHNQTMQIHYEQRFTRERRSALTSLM